MTNSIIFFIVACCLLVSIEAYASCKDGSKLIRYGIDSKGRKEVLNAHNEKRRLIMRGQVYGQPKGVGLKKMQSDSKLEKEAEAISATCEFQHVRVNDDRWHDVGQNLYMEASTRYDPHQNWEKAVDSWFSEHKSFIYPNQSNGVTGHYTQVVWADSDHLGCGFSHFKRGAYYYKLYTCNYGPAGNYVGQAPYKTA